ncbi:MAG: rhomboid family intramembrane serine protease [Desulfobacterales bacterium]|nr:MAG: rhomboid family intramembrane serine protease [Desulfobacterales bacterium]
MTTFVGETISGALHTHGKRFKARLVAWGMTLDVLILLFLLAGLNPHLFGEHSENLLIFFPNSGGWWRFFTHPFVHVSWYHLLLDAGAFFILYTGLQENRIIRKIIYLVLCGGFSLLAAVIFAPLIASKGLGGLSGTAHGLMALSGLEMMHHKAHWRAGLLSFLLVVSKSVYEFMAGEVLFAFMHMGLCGSPLAPCHLGGVVGGIISFFVFRLCKNRRQGN